MDFLLIQSCERISGFEMTYNMWDDLAMLIVLRVHYQLMSLKWTESRWVKLVKCQRKESKTIWLGAGYSGSGP